MSEERCAPPPKVLALPSKQDWLVVGEKGHRLKIFGTDLFRRRQGKLRTQQGTSVYLTDVLN